MFLFASIDQKFYFIFTAMFLFYFPIVSDQWKKDDNSKDYVQSS